VPTEIVVEAEDRPGAIATVGEILGDVGVNIAAAAAFTQSGRGFIHVVVDQADKAAAALHEGGWTILGLREVFTVTLDDQPGELGRFARRLSDRGINITSLYLAGASGGDKELVVVVDDPSHARKHL